MVEDLGDLVVMGKLVLLIVLIEIVDSGFEVFIIYLGELVNVL